jgi:nucleoside 2-deoxyribosyltransferase
MAVEDLQDAPTPLTRPPMRPGARVYLAGPFTEVAEGGSFSDDPSTSGIIRPESPWRRILEATERVLRKKGWEVFLPHRDVSQWGSREASPGVIARECLQAVLGSDCIIAVMSRSFGTHVEVGTAIGGGIPTIVIEADDENVSFFAQAVAECDFVTSLRMANLRELPEIVAGLDFEDALRTAATAVPSGSGDAGHGAAGEVPLP